MNILEIFIDGGDSFQFKLSNQEQITWLNLNVYNQDYTTMPNITDYIINLQFVKEEKINYSFNSIREFIKICMGHMLISNQIFRI
jgi:hypothetical protein